MPRTIPIQTSFAGGELSPKLKGRVETELWKKGLDYCKNFEPLAHGPLLSRGGTRYAQSLDELTSKCRLVEFPRQGDVGFLMVLGSGTLSVRSGITGGKVEAGAIDWIKNPRFTYGWQYWGTNWALAFNGRYYVGFRSELTHGAIGQTVEDLQAGTYQVTLRYSTAVGCGVEVRVGTSGQSSSDLLSEIATATTALSDHATATYTFTTAAAADVSIWLRPANEYLWETVNDWKIGFEVVEVAIRSAGTGYAEWSSGTTPKMPWSDDQLEALQVVAEPARDRAMFFHPEVAPYELIFDSDTGAWAFDEITFTFTDPLDPDWAEPNYPGVAELYQGRLVVGGIPGKRNTLLGSKSGDPYSFKFGTNASDAFSLDISTKGAIRWMHGHRSLLLGTDRGEHVILAQGGVLTPSDFEVRPQSGFGSAAIQTVSVGDQAMYVGRDRRRLRMLSYNLQENGWQTRDLTFTSEHLTAGSIQDMDWLSTGNDQVLAVLRSGEVVAWSYNRPEQIIAPWRVDFGRDQAGSLDPDFARVYALCVLEVGDQDKVWVLVQRVGSVCLEEWIVSDDAERVLLDSYVVATPAAGAVSGLDRLAGKTVIPIVDGVCAAAQTVSGAGEITVSASANSVTVGVFAERTFTTLPKEGGAPGGTAQGARQRMVKASLRLNDSALPVVNGSRCAPDRDPATPMGEVQGRHTGDVTARVLGWEDKGAITVSQDIPLRTEILAIWGVVSTNEA